MGKFPSLGDGTFFAWVELIPGSESGSRSGAFSLTHQAVALGFFPTVTIRHTSGEAEGQIYIPEMNWILAVGCLGLVIVFRESSRLAAAYGVAVTGTMVITSLIYFEVTRSTWRWPILYAVPLLLLFLSFDLPFFLASLAKFASGGFIPVLIGLGFFTVMVTWKRGWELYRRTAAVQLPSLESLVASSDWKQVTRVPGAGIFVRGELPGAPAVLSCLVRQVRAVPRLVVVFSIRTLRVPYASVPSGRPPPKDPEDQQEHHGADKGHEDGRGQTPERGVDVEATKDQASHEGADDSDHDITDDAEATSNHGRGQPSGDQPDGDPQQKRLECHDLLSGEGCWNWRAG